MNATTLAERMLPAFPIFTMSPEEQIATLCDSLYPGAKPQSALMVLGYCRARGMDPMQKPVHIVQIDVKTDRRDEDGPVYEKRDVIMPGIGQYRIQATQTGSYAGQDEPEFGPMQVLDYRKKVTSWEDSPKGGRKKVERWVDTQLEYPEWCKVTVYRFVQGVRCAFEAVEYWLENYGTASAWTEAPNKMWEKRIRGQLAKCAEAQALRKGFPDAVDSAPTADEMEGKHFDFEHDEETGATTATGTTGGLQPPRKAKADDATQPAQGTAAAQAEAASPAAGDEPPPPWEGDKAAAPATASTPAGAVQAPAPTTGAVGFFPATGGEKQNILIKARNAKRDMRELLTKLGDDVSGIDPTTLDGLTKEQFKALKKLLA